MPAADCEARGDHGVTALALGAAIVKLLGLVAAAALKVLLLKGLALAQASLFISVLLFLDSVRRKLGNFKDTYKIEPVQYPEREPDLSGYGHPTSFSEKALLQAAVEKTLSSWPKTDRVERP